MTDNAARSSGRDIEVGQVWIGPTDLRYRVVAVGDGVRLAEGRVQLSCITAGLDARVDVWAKQLRAAFTRESHPLDAPVEGKDG